MPDASKGTLRPPRGADAMAFLGLFAGEAAVKRTKHLITCQRGRAAAWVPIKSPNSAWTGAMKTIALEFGAHCEGYTAPSRLRDDTALKFVGSGKG